MPLQPRGRKNVLIGLSSLVLASLLAAGGMVERTARGTTVKVLQMSLVSLDFAYPTPTVQPTIPVVVLPKADRSVKAISAKSVIVPLERGAAITPPPSTTSTSLESTTLATHYRTISPAKCWDPGPHAIKPTRLFAAMRGVPCGTLVTIRGAAGSITIPIVDHGPNCSCPERGLDASNDAFVAAVGSLSQGIGRVQWHFG